MSREIKFRVWDNKLKRYWFESDDYTNVDKIGYYGDYYRSLVEDFFNSFFDIQKYDRFVLEQYTGSKDKDGKEIYEGDIIEFIKYNSKKIIDKVVFAEMPNGFNSGFIAESAEIGYEGEDFIYLQKSKVIGNINENPELLNEN